MVPGSLGVHFKFVLSNKLLRAARLACIPMASPNMVVVKEVGIPEGPKRPGWKRWSAFAEVGQLSGPRTPGGHYR